MDATDRVGTTGPTAPERAPRVRVAGLACAVRRGPLVGLALACHPGALAVTALACTLAVGAGLGGPRAALVTAAVLTGQLSVGWCNDAYDARRDARA